MQTRLGGISNKIFVSPGRGDNFGGNTDGCRFEEQYDSQREEEMQNQAVIMQRTKLLLPIVDWAYTPLFQAALNQEHLEFNK